MFRQRNPSRRRRPVRADKNLGVFAGVYQDLDHEKIDIAQLGGYYGVYRGGPSGDQGSQAFRSIECGALWAGFGLGAAAMFAGARFSEVHINVTPFGFYAESTSPNNADAAGSQMLSSCVLDDLAFESIGNANFFCAGSRQAQISNNTMNGVGATNCFDDGSGQQLATTVTDWLGVEIGRLSALTDLNGSGWNENYVFGVDPNIPHSGFSGYTCAMVATIGGGDYEATALIEKLAGDGKPWSTWPAGGGATVRYGGSICRVCRASGTISVGELVQSAASAVTGAVVASTGSLPAVGVALTPATNAQAVVVAVSAPSRSTHPRTRSARARRSLSIA